MAWDLEGLIAGLLVIVSCAGEQGCSIQQMLQAIHRVLSGNSELDDGPSQDGQSQEDVSKLKSRAAASIWSWLAQRGDVSIGLSREYNHLTLDQILAHAGLLKVGACTSTDQKFQAESSPQEVRIYASEEAMWESIAGHGVDHRRLPRSEWTLLMGIASTTTHGILQGDLGRLVDQDKRSVPKRTDVLTKKGYISKRTTLVRGTKTSKLWLRRFAPPLVKDAEGDETKPDDMNLSGRFLKSSTDPVPWHSRWTGESIDYRALATTMMAIVKAWGVMKLTDLKKRLGVLGLRWQMKVVSKTCRFLNSRGVIQYVAARLDDRVFKDCIKFVRELDSQDWNLYLATGKRVGKSMATLEASTTELADRFDEGSSLHASPSLLASCAPWSMDEPLPGYIIKTVRSFGDAGLTNPDIYSLTVGSTFTRYLSSLTSAMATSITQPDDQKHMQLKSEHVRFGKVASYRYYVQKPPIPPSASNISTDKDRDVTSETLSSNYGFLPPDSRSKVVKLSANKSFTDLCATASWQRQGRGRPRLQRDETSSKNKNANSHQTDAQESTSPHLPMKTPPPTSISGDSGSSSEQVGQTGHPQSSQGTRDATETGSIEKRGSRSTRTTREREIAAVYNLTSHNVLNDNTKKVIDRNVNAVNTPQLHDDSSDAEKVVTLTTDNKIATNNDNVDKNDDNDDPNGSHNEQDLAASQPLEEESAATNATAADTDAPSSRGQVSGRGRGTGGRTRGGGDRREGKKSSGKKKSGTSAARAEKPYKCEKCGGSWKNDLGLKYHLEKARTSCNPSWDPSQEALKTARRPKKLLREIGQLSSSLDSATSRTGATSDGQDGNDIQTELKITNAPSVQTSPRQEKPVFRRKFVSVDTLNETRSPENHFSRKISQDRRKAQRPSGDSSTMLNFSPLQSGNAVLLQDDSAQTQQVSDIFQQCATAMAKTWQENIVGSHPSTIGITTAMTVREAALPHNTKGDDDHDGSLALKENLDKIDSQATRVQSKQMECSRQNRRLAESTPKQPISRIERNRRIGNLLNEILTERKGVFPGGEALWRALTAVWVRRFHGEPPPLTRDYQAAVRSLVNKKVVSEHWHAFRSRSGVFTKCHLITKPNVDIFSPQAVGMIDKITASHPRPYFPPHPGHVEDADFRVDGDFLRQTRRPLPSKISTLSAPVYAAQLAAKRELEDASSDIGPIKRIKRRQGPHSTGDSDGFDLNKLRGQERRRHIRWISDEFAEPFGSFTNHEVRPDIQFLDPNTFMDREPPGYSPEELNVASRVLSRLKRSKRGSLSWAKDQESQLLDDGILSHSAGIVPALSIREAAAVGTWPQLEATHFESGSSFTLQGWMPSSRWFAWACINEEVDKQVTSRAARRRYLYPDENVQTGRFFSRLQACKSVERSWFKGFINTPPGAACPHNIFVHFAGPTVPEAPELPRLKWPSDGQLTLGNFDTDTLISDTESSSLSDEEPDAASIALFARRRHGSRRKKKSQDAPKRAPLVTRRLTTIMRDTTKLDSSGQGPAQYRVIENPQEVTAGIVSVRVLLGGADKHIDWGLLLKIFPEIGLASLRKFWIGLMKTRGPYISKYTAAFQECFIAAYEAGEMPMIDYDNLLDYDWHNLIQWALEIPRHEMVDIPETKKELEERFDLCDSKRIVEDWREKFFHVQASTYGRFEASTSVAGAVAVATGTGLSDQWATPCLDEVDVARSWIKSLCCTGETRYTPLQIREQLLMIGHTNDPAKVAVLLKSAIDELTAQRIIHKSRRPALGGRPYRLTEWYTTTLSKLAQKTKYDEAAVFKAQLDAAFSRGQHFEIPYTLSDGAMMALTNLMGHGRVKLETLGVPYVPFGLEPRNYESRKFPKSYYHFGLEVAPTDRYEYNENIETLAIVGETAPPGQGQTRELPQWVDFFGEYDNERWCDVLGSFCFAYSTRGQMTVEGICSAMKPILDEFEAHMIIEWGERTGVLETAHTGNGVTVGEWWWLAVPWQRSHNGV